MDQKVVGLAGQTSVVERAPEDLSEVVVDELINLVQRVEDQIAAKDQSTAAAWVYRVPFPGVRYYYFER